MNFKGKLFVGHGTVDPVVDFTKGEETVNFLKSHQLDCEFRTYYMMHEIDDEEIQHVNKFIKSWS